jgi:hypothetical protein
VVPSVRMGILVNVNVRLKNVGNIHNNII